MYRSYCVHLHPRASASKTVRRTSRSCFLALHLPSTHGAQESEGEGHRGRVDLERATVGRMRPRHRGDVTFSGRRGVPLGSDTSQTYL